MSDFKSKIFQQVKNLDFVQNELQELTLDEQKDFCAENLEIIYQDDFGQCAVFLRIEDYCAIRDIDGSWRKATVSECYQMKEGVLEGMYHIF